MYSHAYSPNLQGSEIGSYTLLFDFIVSRVIDLIGEGGYAGKGFMIITKNVPDQLAKAINDDLGRGVTFYFWSRLL